MLPSPLYNYTKADGSINYKLDSDSETEMKPDCSRQKQGYKVCTLCNHEEPIPYEHTLLKDSNGNIKYTVEASCESNAKAVCTTCNKVVTLPGTAHTAKLTLPTCTEPGSLVCTKCNKDLAGDPEYVEFLKDETGKEITLETLAKPLGHDFKNSTTFTKADGTEVTICGRCRQEIPVIRLVSSKAVDTKANATNISNLLGAENAGKFTANMAQLDSVKVADKNITVTLKDAKALTAYQGGELDKNGDPISRKYFAILVDTGMARVQLKPVKPTGSDYGITQADIDGSEAWGAKSTEVIMWLSVERFEELNGTMKVKFVDSKNEKMKQHLQ